MHLISSYGTGKLASYGTGKLGAVMLAVGQRDVLWLVVGIVVVLLLAALVGYVFRTVAPEHAGASAIATFIVGLVIVLVAALS